MLHARLSFLSMLLAAFAAVVAGVASPARAAAADVGKADAAKVVVFMDKLSDKVLADQENCDKMASDVSAHIDANKELIEKASAATKSGAKLPKESQDRVMAAVNKMTPGLMKCMQNKKVEAAFEKLNVLARPAAK